MFTPGTTPQLARVRVVGCKPTASLLQLPGHNSCKLARPARPPYCPYAHLCMHSSDAHESLPACAPASETYARGSLNTAIGAAAHLADATTSQRRCSQKGCNSAAHDPSWLSTATPPPACRAPMNTAAESSTATSGIAATQQMYPCHRHSQVLSSPACGISFASWHAAPWSRISPTTQSTTTGWQGLIGRL
jgi:hypothetical protein